MILIFIYRIIYDLIENKIFSAYKKVLTFLPFITQLDCFLDIHFMLIWIRFFLIKKSTVSKIKCNSIYILSNTTRWTLLSAASQEKKSIFTCGCYNGSSRVFFLNIPLTQYNNFEVLITFAHKTKKFQMYFKDINHYLVNDIFW